MNLTVEIARSNLDPALMELLSATLTQVRHDAVALKLATLKNQALTLELAYYKRIRFANKKRSLHSRTAVVV